MLSASSQSTRVAPALTWPGGADPPVTSPALSLPLHGRKVNERQISQLSFGSRKLKRTFAEISGSDWFKSAPIGENAPTVRARICAGLGFLGIQMEEERNATNKGVISAPASRIVVHVIHTDEKG